MNEIKFVTVAVVLVVAMLIGGMMACDMRDRQLQLDMAAKGMCKMPYASSIWVPCK